MADTEQCEAEASGTAAAEPQNAMSALENHVSKAASSTVPPIAWSVPKKKLLLEVSLTVVPMKGNELQRPWQCKLGSTVRTWINILSVLKRNQSVYPELKNHVPSVSETSTSKCDSVTERFRNMYKLLLKKSEDLRNRTMEDVRKDDYLSLLFDEAAAYRAAQQEKDIESARKQMAKDLAIQGLRNADIRCVMILNKHAARLHA